MDIQVFPTGPLSTNAYVVSCAETKKAAVIDPAFGSARPMARYVQKNGLECVWILLTHSHWDHIADLALCKELFPEARIALHPLDAKNVEEPGSDGLPGLCPLSPMQIDYLLMEGEEILWGNLRFLVLHTPGHSPGGVCLYESREGVLFSGDTLFQGAIGSLTLPTSQPERMESSLQKLWDLPGKTRVYPGHGSPTTIEQERRR